MRLAQDAPLVADPIATAIPTYDLGCPFGVQTDKCPWGSVHNVNKRPVGARVAGQLLRLLELQTGATPEGPRATIARAKTMVGRNSGVSTTVTVKFSGGTEPFALRPTQNCAVCCNSNGAVGSNDFDVSGDGGQSWFNSTGSATLSGTVVTFTAPLHKVTHVRYTANQAFPQCAVINAEGMPALPFQIAVTATI